MNTPLTPEALLSLLLSGEGYNVEFKIHVPNKLKEMSEEICAFANVAGGLLLLGVGDDNIIHGVEIDNGKRSVPKALKSAKLGTYLDVSSFETPFSYCGRMSNANERFFFGISKTIVL